MARAAKILAELEPPNVAKLKREASQAAARVKQLEAAVESLQKRIDHRGFRLPIAKPYSTKGAYLRMQIPDTHGSAVDKAAVAAMLGDMQSVRPAEVVWMGDQLECGGFLAQHHTMGYVAQMSYTFEDDIAATNELIDRVSEIVPPKQQHFLTGNHEGRIESWCVTQSLKGGGGGDASYLLKCHSAPSVLRFAARGVNHYSRDGFHMGLRVRGAIKLGSCHFTHGMFVGTDAAKKHLAEFGGNVVFGHTHRNLSYITQSVNAGTIGAWSIGCLCELRPYWQHTKLAGWTHAYGLQIVQPSGDFLHITVPIIDGKSYLGTLTEKMT